MLEYYNSLHDETNVLERGEYRVCMCSELSRPLASEREWGYDVPIYIRLDSNHFPHALARITICDSKSQYVYPFLGKAVRREGFIAR